MHDAKRVCFSERLANLQSIGDCSVDRKRAVTSDERAEIDALEMLHHQVRATRVELPHIHDLHHVLATERSKRAALVQETFDHGSFADERLAQEFDCHRLLELRVATKTHDTHAAFCENALDQVPPREKLTSGYR